MPPPRMTANPQRPARYRPGKGHDTPSDTEESDSEQEQEQQQQAQAPPKFKTAPKPPARTSKVTSAFSEVTIAAPPINEDEFETESEEETKQKSTKPRPEAGAIAGSGSEESSSGEEDEDGGSDEDSDDTSSSDDSPPPPLLRPTFIRKTQRDPASTTTNSHAQQEPPTTKSFEELQAEEIARRKAAATALVQEQLEKNAAARALEKKAWDDDEDAVGLVRVADETQIDDTDNLDPEAEYAAWKLRELKRIQRERAAIEEAEAERAEVERRRNLSKEKRDAEDEEFLAAQKEEQEGKGKAGFMQKYFHKGAFFQDDEYAKEEGLDKRDIMGSRFADQVGNREVLPEYMQIRDMSKLGKKGRTKYKDLRAEDTGRWGDFRERRRDGGGGMGTGGGGDTAGFAGGADVDERFRPDDSRRDMGPSGANATVLRERKKEMAAPEDAPKGPKGDSYRGDNSQERPKRRDSRDRYRDGGRDDRRRRSPSPVHRRRDSRDRERRKRSRSPSYRRERYDEPDKRRRVS